MDIETVSSIEKAAQERRPVSVVADLEGENYLVVLSRLHQFLRPQTYLEIGSRSGDSLALANCASIAIDPDFNLKPSFLGQKTTCALYRLESDRFFAAVNPEHILGGKIDLAFLDGLHLAEFLLRDFINTERHCKTNSIIAMHDCVPVDVTITRRVEIAPDVVANSSHPLWWTGDVWKVLVAIKKYRPEIQMHVVDAEPTGLVLLTGLDPSSTVLRDNYFNIVEEFRGLDLRLFGIDTFVSALDLIPTQSLATYEDVSRYFWL